MLQFPESNEFLFLVLIMPHVHVLSLKYLSYVIKCFVSLSHVSATKPSHCGLGHKDPVKVQEKKTVDKQR